MKKITSEKEFDFKINSSLTIKLSPQGVVVEDDVARNVVSRLAGIVNVENVDVVKKPSDETKEENIEEVSNDKATKEESKEPKKAKKPKKIIEADKVVSDDAPTTKRTRWF